MNDYFDPIDLALLAAGWQGTHTPLSIEDADALVAVAKMLHRLFGEVCDEDGWHGVWGYDIAEPLGAQLADRGDWDMKTAEQLARSLVSAELEHIA